MKTFFAPRQLVAAGVLGLVATGAGLATAGPAFAAGPANDNFAFAQFLPGPNNSVGGRTTNATAEAGEPTHGGKAPHASLWYKWTAPATGTAVFRTVNSNTTFDTTMSVYTGNSLATLVSVGENDDTNVPGLTSTRSTVAFKAVKGTEYKIAVDGFGTATGDFTLTWNGNDDFAAAETLSGASGFFNAHNEALTAEPGEPGHGGDAANASAWYRWVAPISGIATVDSRQNNFASQLGVYTGASVNALTSVAQSDPAKKAKVVFAAKAGTEYRIAVDGAALAQGTEVFAFNVVAAKVSVGNATVVEGAAGTKTVNVAVTLNTAAPGPVNVNFATKDGTAFAGSDYNAASGTVTFPAGFTTKFITLAVKGDTVKEPTESFTVNLSTPTGGFAIGTGTGTVTITNDD
jgi:hypothetical protein